MNDDLSPEARAAFDALPKTADPPPALEEAVVRALRAHGVLASKRSWRAPALLAAGVALFAAGLAVGRVPPKQVPYGTRYLLLLFDDTAAAPTDEAARVAEYRVWVRSLAHPGTIVRGDKLAPEARVLTKDANGVSATELAAEAPRGVLGGLFVVEAKSWDEAVSLAKTCPHLAHGGRVVVRKVEET